MPNWYYKTGETETGPISGALLKKLALDETINEKTHVRRDDMPNWIDAGKIKGLIPVRDSVPTGQVDSKQTVAPAPNHLESLGSRILSGAKAAASVAAKKAQLTQLEWTRASADERLGAKVYAGAFGQSENEAVFSRISEIEVRVNELRQPELAVEGESAREKAARFATEGKKKIHIESLLSERKKLLRELGAFNRTKNFEQVPDELHAEYKTAAKHDTEIQRLQAEIAAIDSPLARLSSKVKGYSKIGLAAALVISVGFFTARLLRGSAGSAYQDFAELQKEADLEAKKIQAEIAEIKNDSEREKAERQAARKIEEQQERLDIARREAETEKRVRQKEANQALSRLENSRRRAELEQRAREKEADEALARKKSMAESEERLVAAQVDRQKLAERLFGSISLQPSSTIALSSTLEKKHKVSVELRGNDYESISTLHASKEWLKLINVVLKSSYNELPEATIIEEAAKRLGRRNFQMLVRTDSILDSESYGGPVLIQLGFSPDSRSLVSVDFHWERHPDAIGYYKRWAPNDGYSILVFTYINTVREFIGRINQQYNEKTSDSYTRQKLGEIDSASAGVQLAALRSQLIDEAAAWARGL